MIQLCVGARFGGYALSWTSSYFWKMPQEMKTSAVWIDVYLITYEWIKEGVIAKDIAEKYYQYFEKHGYSQYYLYGPCQGVGIIEVETLVGKPQISLKENMTFMADTSSPLLQYGFRWEDG